LFNSFIITGDVILPLLVLWGEGAMDGLIACLCVHCAPCTVSSHISETIADLFF